MCSWKKRCQGGARDPTEKERETEGRGEGPRTITPYGKNPRSKITKEKEEGVAGHNERSERVPRFT